MNHSSIMGDVKSVWKRNKICRRIKIKQGKKDMLKTKEIDMVYGRVCSEFRVSIVFVWSGEETQTQTDIETNIGKPYLLRHVDLIYGCFYELFCKMIAVVF